MICPNCDELCVTTSTCSVCEAILCEHCEDINGDIIFCNECADEYFKPLKVPETFNWNAVLRQHKNLFLEWDKKLRDSGLKDIEFRLRTNGQIRNDWITNRGDEIQVRARLHKYYSGQEYRHMVLTFVREFPLWGTDVFPYAIKHLILLRWENGNRETEIKFINDNIKQIQYPWFRRGKCNKDTYYNLINTLHKFAIQWYCLNVKDDNDIDYKEFIEKNNCCPLV